METTGKTLMVTGAGGFIGLRMIERARERGLAVRGLERSPEAARRAERAGAEVVVGDVCDPEAARRACAGAAIVFHTAAILEEDGELEPFRRVNVGGTVTVAEAARAAGVRRFVHLSSVMVYGFKFPPWVREEGPLAGDGNPYCITKIESEEALRPFHRSGGMEVIVIRPGDVYGPGSVPWVVRPIGLMKKRLFALAGHGVLNHVYIDNLLDAVFLALERDATGEPFNVTDGQATSCAEYFGRLARMVNQRRILTLPPRLARTTFRALEGGARLLRVKPPVRAAAVDYVTRPHGYSNERARARLGWTPAVGLDEGMARVERWLRAERMI